MISWCCHGVFLVLMSVQALWWCLARQRQYAVMIFSAMTICFNAAMEPSLKLNWCLALIMLPCDDNMLWCLHHLPSDDVWPHGDVWPYDDVRQTGRAKTLCCQGVFLVMTSGLGRSRSAWPSDDKISLQCRRQHALRIHIWPTLSCNTMLCYENKQTN